jgi:hypothetical protein
MKRWLSFVFAVLVWFSGNAGAVVFTSELLDFIAPEQNLWGGGSDSGFGSTHDDEVAGFINYSITSSSGSVSGQFQGRLTADYADYLRRPGTTSLSLSFMGDGLGQISSLLGVSAELSVVGIEVIDWDRLLNVVDEFSPVLGQEQTASDSISVVDVGLNALVLEIGAGIGIEQTNSFTAQGVDGFLAYSRRGSGVTNYMSFEDLTGVDMNLDINLTEPGTWDFWLEELLLVNVFDVEFEAEIYAYEEHTSAGWRRRCVGRSWYRTCWWVPDVYTTRNELTLAEVGLYQGDAFGLAFDEVSTRNGFSIFVDMPIPGTMLLIALGLATVRLTRVKR